MTSFFHGHFNELPNLTYLIATWETPAWLQYIKQLKQLEPTLLKASRGRKMFFCFFKLALRSAVYQMIFFAARWGYFLLFILGGSYDKLYFKGEPYRFSG